jgi:hypothetical protein
MPEVGPAPVSSSLPSYAESTSGEPIVQRLAELLAAAHRIWSSPDERRRMRAFGFRPAVEAGVLKRDWRGLQVRVSGIGIRVTRPGGGELTYVATEGPPILTLDGRPMTEASNGTPAAAALIAGVLDLVGAYERWVEAREGRQERMGRAARQTSADRRPLNALAETRRLQRILQTATPRRRGR